MTEQTDFIAPLVVADLKSNREIGFLIVPGEAHLDQIAKDLGLLSLRKVRFEGAVRPDGAKDWVVEARLGATVGQACVVTLDPVTTRIEKKTLRKFLNDWVDVGPDDDEVEMPEDDTVDPLGCLLYTSPSPRDS